ncbi:MULTISPECIES: hypothetical protein [unclassified Spirillospora]|uniref:hypothetical protein n=1 Tax=unclassified Spirillospora TaxID=2642701 RepID=UPI003711A94A
MRSRISGRLLPAALAAATVTAIAAPATAQEAPPPAEETYSEGECAEALKVLSYFKLLPDQPDIGRALCSMNAEKQEETPQDAMQQDQAQDDAAQQEDAAQEQTTDELSSTYTTDTGQTVKENKLLGIPVEWPKSLTVHVPTVNDQWHSYTATQG